MHRTVHYNEKLAENVNGKATLETEIMQKHGSLKYGKSGKWKCTLHPLNPEYTGLIFTTTIFNNQSLTFLKLVKHIYIVNIRDNPYSSSAQFSSWHVKIIYYLINIIIDLYIKIKFISLRSLSFYDASYDLHTPILN